MQRKPFRKKALDPKFKSLFHDLNKYLKIKFNELEDKGASILSPYFPQYMHSAEVRMFLEKLHVEAGHLAAPSCWNKHFEFLSENTRGIRGHKLAPKTFQNGYQSTTESTYKLVNKLLTEMLNLTKDKMAFDNKIRNRLPKKPK